MSFPKLAFRSAAVALFALGLGACSLNSSDSADAGSPSAPEANTNPTAPVTGAVSAVPVVGAPLADGLNTVTGMVPLPTDTSALPTGSLPTDTSALPTGSLPTGGLPTGSLPTDTSALSSVPVVGEQAAGAVGTITSAVPLP